MIDLRAGSVFVRFGLRSLVFLCFSALLLVACGGESAGPEQGADIEDIQQQDQTEAFNEREFFENPDNFVGREVTVSGKVTDEVLRARAFRLSGEDVGAPPLLVVSSQQANVETGQVVRVTGTVRRFDIQEFTRDLEEIFGVDFNAPEFREFVGQPVIVAQSVTVIEGADPDVAQETATPSAKTTTATPTG
ncbi:MAG: DUF4131 domain-containing protein [Actinomycetota bacterium]|nr:DUF4131 domain-containing protein [Actinomycetota bacterium]